MRFNVQSLRAEKGATMLLNIREELAPIDLGRSRLRFVGPVEFVGQATNTGRRIVVTGSAKGQAIAVCDRCLEEFTMDLATQLTNPTIAPTRLLPILTRMSAHMVRTTLSTSPQAWSRHSCSHCLFGSCAAMTARGFARGAVVI